MKKLVALILVLGFSSLANAGLIFTVNGEPQPEEISLTPSETITLDLHLAQDQKMWGFTLDYVLSNDQAEFVWDSIEFPDGDKFYLNAKTTRTEPQMVSITASNFLSPAIDGPLDLMDGLVIHCVEMTDVVLEVKAQSGTQFGPDGTEVIAPGTVLHTLTIHQIPEPATMALLGLGGLFLLRRRK
jgi:hypothetical protein